MTQNPNAQPIPVTVTGLPATHKVSVVAQVRQLTQVEVNFAYSVAAGDEVLAVPASTLAADTLLLQGFDSTVNIEFYGAQGTSWGNGTPLIGVLARTGHVGAIYCRVDPAAATNGDIRVSQTRAIASSERI